MFQQYLNQANTAVAYLSSDELKELIDDDEKLEERINDVVRNSLLLFSIFLHMPNQMELITHNICYCVQSNETKIGIYVILVNKINVFT